jgi:hypothetical protein
VPALSRCMSRCARERPDVRLMAAVLAIACTLASTNGYLAT